MSETTSYRDVIAIAMESTRRRMHHEGSDFREAAIVLAALPVLAAHLAAIESGHGPSIDEAVHHLAAGFRPEER